MTDKPSIAVLGAGAIGCAIGGLLARNGHKVRLIGRKASGAMIRNSGFVLSALDSETITVSPEDFSWHEHPSKLADMDIILLCVKCPATGKAAEQIAKYAHANSTIISLQNGVGNIEILKSILPRQKVLTGMVVFNVVKFDEIPPRFHRATEGFVVIEADEASHILCQSLVQSGIEARTTDRIENVVWGKMLLNLNNAVNVLSGLPLKAQLQQRSYRRVMALCILETLKVLDANGIEPEKIAKVSPKMLPHVLRLPDFIFNRIAKSMLNMDDDARTSMWADLQNGREPEIDYLNGAVGRLGANSGIATPVNDTVTKLIQKAFVQGVSPDISGKQLLALVANS